jgi:hypothetical protein
VAIPANPSALAVAKRLNISPDTRQLVFKKHDHIRRREIMEQARATLARLNEAEQRCRFEKQQRDPVWDRVATMSDFEFKLWLDS